MPDKRAVNPWTWQDRRGFTQAWRVDRPGTLFLLSGQGPSDADGNLVGAGDFRAQVGQTFSNLARLLDACGADLTDIVKLTVYLTDIATLPDYTRIKASFTPGAQPASTAVAVAALPLPGMMIEIDAVAVQ